MHRRTLLSVAFWLTAGGALAAPLDVREAERAIGNQDAPHSVVEWFSLTCPHCAAFAKETLPELKDKFVTPGKLRWAFCDYPTDGLALQAAMVARCLPIRRYEPFIETLFGNQAHWAYGSGNPTDALWLLASDSGMDRTMFDRAVADTGLRDWIVSRAMDAEARWSIDATPSFLVNGKLYTGAMSAAEFSTILAS